MNRQPRLLVALDIDGTIVPDGSLDIPDETVTTVRDLAADGHHVVLSTGRSLVGTLPIARALGLTSGAIVCSNGAVTARLDPAVPRGCRVVKAHNFAVGPVLTTVRRILFGVQVGVEVVGWGYEVTRLFGPSEVNGAQRIMSLDRLARVRTPRMILRAPSVLDLADDLRGLGVTATPAAADWLDVTPGGVSKASALDLVRQALGVGRDATVGVGDGLNDLPVFEWAAYAVAMGQASDAVTAAADEVTGPIEEQGLVPVLRTLISTPLPARAR